MPEIKPPKGKPPEPSNRLPRVSLFCSIRDLLIAVCLTVSQDAYAIRRADLLDVAVHDDIAELLVQLNGSADAVGLLTGNEGRTGAAEGVQHHRVCHTGVADGISQQRDRLHGGMVAVLLGFVELPDSGFLPARVPLVLAVFLPAVQHRLMLPLVRRTSQHKGLLLPDTAAG